MKNTVLEEKIDNLIGEVKNMENDLLLNDVRNGIEKLNQNDVDLLNMVHVEMENAKEERRILNENLAQTQVSLSNDSEQKFENMKGQMGVILMANNEAIIRAGNVGISKIKDVIIVQNNQNKNSLEIQGDVKIIMENMGRRWIK
jgi:hypothetical protein